MPDIIVINSGWHDMHNIGSFKKLLIKVLSVLKKRYDKLNTTDPFSAMNVRVIWKGNLVTKEYRLERINFESKFVLGSVGIPFVDITKVLDYLPRFHIGSYFL